MNLKDTMNLEDVVWEERNQYKGYSLDDSIHINLKTHKTNLWW